MALIGKAEQVLPETVVSESTRERTIPPSLRHCAGAVRCWMTAIWSRQVRLTVTLAFCDCLLEAPT